MSILPKPDIITEEYTYQSLLGKGGFGAVYKCKNSKGQLLAIKRITNEQASLEAKTMSCLNGPEFRKYFVQFYNFFESRNGVKCIVMEYCELGSLENARLSPVYTDQEKTINHYFAQLIKGVKKLHNIKLMHRDLKPANILVTKINDKTRLKIADFGLARDAPDSIANLTFCGTPYYMAPEILKGDPYEKSVDIYSLGGIKYFMSEKKHPIGLQFYKCGYPKIKDGHNSLIGRMLCQKNKKE